MERPLIYNLQYFGGRGASSGGTKVYHLYHGSPNANIDSFDVAKAGTNTSTGENLIFFTNSKEFADEFSYERLETDSMFVNRKGQKGMVYEADVTIKSPLNLTRLSNKDKNNLIELSDGELTKSEIDRFSKGNNQLLKSYIDLDRLKDFGYDSIIAKLNKKGDLEYGIVNNKQVKIRKSK